MMNTNFTEDFFNQLSEKNSKLREEVKKNLSTPNRKTFEEYSLIKKSEEKKNFFEILFGFLFFSILCSLIYFSFEAFKTNASYEQEISNKIQKEISMYDSMYQEYKEKGVIPNTPEINSIKINKKLDVKIKLKRFVQDSTPRTDKIVITSDKQFSVIKNGVINDGKYTRYEIEKREQDLMNTSNGKNEYYEFISSDKNTPLVIKSRDRIPSRIKDEESRKRNNDNQFLGKIRYQNVNGEETYINELPLEDYIKGIAETAGRTHIEKKKAMSIMSRSYIYFYSTSPFKKFEGKNYDLEDDPATSQKYLGYGYQMRNKERVDVVNETSGLVLFDQMNNPFIAPYSTCTLRNEKGELKRKTLEQAKRGNEKKGDIYKFGTNVITDVDDQYGECDPKQKPGHGVGLSGNGSEKLASEHNYNYEQIIKYYFKNISIKNINEL